MEQPIPTSNIYIPSDSHHEISGETAQYQHQKQNENEEK
jgi:hypothetical protein